MQDNFVVMKFGGSCLNGVEDVKRAVEIVKREVSSGKRPIITTSAFKGITDELIAQAKKALVGSFNTEKIRKLHLDVLEVLPSPARKDAQVKINDLLLGLEDALSTISSSGRLEPETMDNVISYGERLAIEILAAFLNRSGLDSQPLSGASAGLVTNSNFRNASILDESVPLIRKLLSTGPIPVVAGFFGEDRERRIATLGRGGSDYIATFIASALECETVLLKDVKGLMTADPRIVPSAKTVSSMSHKAALELAHYGSKIIFEKAVIPAMRKKLPVRIAYFYDPSISTTVGIGGDSVAIASRKGMVLLEFTCDASINALGLMVDVMTKIRDLDIDPQILLKASKLGFLLLLDRDMTDVLKGIMMNVIGNHGIEEGFGTVAVVGNGMAQKRVEEVLTAMREAGVETIKLVFQVSEHSLCVVLKEQDVDEASRVLHRLLVETS